MLAVVGARDMRPWMKEWFDNELLPVLKAFRVGVVSGGARGVDQYAHQMALRAEMPTVAVLPSGLEQIYPFQLKRFTMHKNFHLISEYAPSTEMRKHHFYRRNQIIAALTPLLLVVQAASKSGSMITAQQACAMGVNLATLPGSVCDPAFSGNNQLIFDGALVVRNRWDLSELIQRYVINH